MPGSGSTSNRRYALLFIILVLAIVILDQISKQWIIDTLPLGQSLPEIGPLTIIHIQNTGAAFGFFQDQQIFLSFMAIAGLIVVLLMFRYIPDLGYPAAIAISLLFGGALGNLIDRLRMGHVTDFIYVRLWGDVFWPAFNVADSAIAVGSIALAIILYFKIKKEDESESKLSSKKFPGG